MMAVNSIGAFAFLHFDGVPEPLTRGSLTIRRSNVQGLDHKITALQGRHFTLVSKVDVVDLEAGETLHQSYLGLIDANPVILIWNDVNYLASYGWVTQVKDVRKQLAERRLNIKPQIVGPPPVSTAWLEVVWDLVFHSEVP